MLNFVVETKKKEYTIQLSNLIFFKIYEGFNSLYKKSIEKTTEEEVLKNFQKSLKKVPKWDQSLIDNETARVCIDNYEIIENLLKAIIKSNIIMLTYDPISKNNKVDMNKYYNIKVNKLIHQVYIECAREIFNNPFLFYHKYNALELKRNQRDIFKIIKNNVEEAIRKLLPMKDILEIYLGDNFSPIEVIDKLSEKAPINNKYNKAIDQYRNQPLVQHINQPLDQHINQPLVQHINQPLDQHINQPLDQHINQPLDQHITQPLVRKQPLDQPNQKKDTIQSILDRNDINLSTSSDINKNFIKQVQYNETVDKVKTNEKSLDSKIKEILNKDLNDSETDISLSYKPENTENYQEIFGNTEKEPNKVNIKEATKININESINSINTAEKKNLMKKNKFFNNYINF